ncbi:hypothetical protein CC78DRAFT_534790 [Lojkania enalia]|uniref:Protein HRI1 n=1 Tax=Lojkania enalia TaxID=147567 RepID=A0A9P4K4I4_9PLEO|nr:hypothetical protein CC78DRAFT_534790 [Didymosphaeria enalia]
MSTTLPTLTSNPSNASISVRKYIYHLPYPLPLGTPIPYTPNLPTYNPLNLDPNASEPTHTLVLTTPASTFVDLRILKRTSGFDTEAPNNGKPGRLEWGFAGVSRSVAVLDAGQPMRNRDDSGQDGERASSNAPTSISTYTCTRLGNGNGNGNGIKNGTWIPEIRHSIWTHTVDSRHPLNSPFMPPDEGDMYPLPNNPDLTLEFGTAFNPLTNMHMNYEEMWQDVKIDVCGPERLKYAVCLKLEQPTTNTRGVVVRVGQFVQGIVKNGEQTTVERWEFTGEGEGEGWKRIVNIGMSFVPCVVTFRPTELEIGGKVRYQGSEWVVDELVGWE